MLTKTMREKYAPKTRSNGIVAFPAGGQDVMSLCFTCDSLKAELERVQRVLGAKYRDADEQSAIATAIWRSGA